MLYDVIVIGAGLAGVTAAAKLKAAGHAVLLLEGRSRAGGRGFYRTFIGSNDGLDFGGAWITPWHHRIRKLCAEHDVELRPRHPITARRWFYDGQLHTGAPNSREHSAALDLVTAHAKLLKQGKTIDSDGRDFGDVTFADYLDLIAAPQTARDELSAWWSVSGNGDKSRVPATELLSSAGYHDGTLDGICAVWAETLEGGVEELCTRMIGKAGLDVRHGAEVSRVEDAGSDASVTTASDERFRSRAVIVASGLNPMVRIAFSPPLSGKRGEGQRLGHLGRAVKLWVKLQGVPVGILATGGGEGIEWMFTERQAADGAVFAVGFGVAGSGWKPSFPVDAERAVKRFFPEARLLACDWHDWNADPYSRGTWVAGIAGNAEIHAAPVWAPGGRIAFASSDIAPESAGWFEAAIVSGEAAADAIAGRLAGAPPGEMESFRRKGLAPAQ
jgi:monoamine oxidase